MGSSAKHFLAGMRSAFPLFPKEDDFPVFQLPERVRNSPALALKEKMLANILSRRTVEDAFLEDKKAMLNDRLRMAQDHQRALGQMKIK
ncbi:MAG: hypothetical protein G8345_05555 [Magnetococcales bacterium]|nr:hypothetical protein [Magnetococcales bacterium]NGZ26335.1 hypothetical protein [Magnetococcales bacterium]